MKIVNEEHKTTPAVWIERENGYILSKQKLSLFEITTPNRKFIASVTADDTFPPVRETYSIGKTIVM